MQQIYEYLESPRDEVRKMAVELLAGLSADEEQVVGVMRGDPKKYISPVFSKLSDASEIAALAWDTLINFSTDRDVALYLVDTHLEAVLSSIKSRESIFSDAATKLFSNMTKVADKRAEIMAPLLSHLMPIYLAGVKHNPNCDYSYLASCMADVTNIKEARLYFMEDLRRLDALLPDLHSRAVVRRGGIASLIKNCLFETDYHAAILEKEIADDFLITTLAGRLLDVRSKLSGEEREKLPVELQLLDNLEAESDIVIRSILIESLIVLGTTREGRDTIRAKEVYPILREWHKLEEDHDMKDLVAKLVELLIRDEQTSRAEPSQVNS